MGFEELTEHIKGSYINDIGTAADLLWISTENDGKQYAVHIQSPYRITVNDNILCGIYDFYENKEYFDEKLQECRKLLPCRITEIHISKNNDLHILSEKITVETFTNRSVDDLEVWRMFERHCESKPHYVAYSHEICEE